MVVHVVEAEAEAEAEQQPSRHSSSHLDHLRKERDCPANQLSPSASKLGMPVKAQAESFGAVDGRIKGFEGHQHCSNIPAPPAGRCDRR